MFHVEHKIILAKHLKFCDFFLEPMSIIISLSNQKGGVGKTTSAVNISCFFALNGYKVLLIDIDPQASATSGVGFVKNRSEPDLYDMFLGTLSIQKLLKETSLKNLNLVPASPDLISLELELGKKPARELLLKSELKTIQNQYDLIFIDCPPSSGLLTLNALGASDYVIIPLQAEYFALEGISALTGTIDFVKQTFNPELLVLGVVLTMFDSRTNLAGQVESEVFAYYGKRMFETKIPRNIKLSECPSHGLSIFEYDQNCSGSRAYKALCEEIEQRLELKIVGLAVNS